MMRASFTALCALLLAHFADAIVSGAEDRGNISYWSSPAPATMWSPRFVFATAMDAARDRLYVVSGMSMSGEYTNDAWMSPDSGASWTCQSNCEDQDREATSLQQESFPPRCSAGLGVNSDGVLFLLGGNTAMMPGSNGSYFSDLWNSTDAGVSWNLMVSQGPWGPNRLFGSPFVMFDRNDDAWFVMDGRLWFVQKAEGYARFLDQGALDLGGGGLQRSAFGMYLSARDQVLFLVGGQPLSGGPPFFNDVWMAHLSGVSPSAFTLLTSAAPWSPRWFPDMVGDSQGNLYIFGEEPTKENPRPDLLWVAPQGPQQGATWVRLDSSAGATPGISVNECVRTWPFPANNGDIFAVIDSRDRLLLLSEGARADSPVTNSATAIVQLLSTPATDAANIAQHLTQWSFPGCAGSPPSGDNGGGLGGPSRAESIGVVVGGCALLVVVALLAWLCTGRKVRSALVAESSTSLYGPYRAL